jgi:2-enoate reductase
MREHGLDLRLSTEVTPETLARSTFDAAVCCTGSHPTLPAISTHAPPAAIFATELLLAPSLAEHAERTVIVGGGDVGCETAHMLAFQYGKNVTIVEESPYLMRASCTANRGYLVHHLDRRGVALWNCARIEWIGDGVVAVVRNVSPTVPAPWAAWEPMLPENVPNPFARQIRVEARTVELRADLVVFATGLAPNNGLYRACVELRVAPELHNIGDAFRVGRIFDATKAAYAIGAAL